NVAEDSRVNVRRSEGLYRAAVRTSVLRLPTPPCAPARDPLECLDRREAIRIERAELSHQRMLRRGAEQPELRGIGGLRATSRPAGFEVLDRALGLELPQHLLGADEHGLGQAREPRDVDAV